MTHSSTLLAFFAAFFASANASALDLPEPLSGPQMPAFVCHGESESVLNGLSTSEMKDERDKRLRQLTEHRVPQERLAHQHCVTAEIMRRIGDLDAENHYRIAIALNPREPGYELFYARYLQWSRGAAKPLTEDAEVHNLRALEKLEDFEGVTQVGSTNAVARDWTKKNLLTLYEQDGIALLPYGSKAYPYDNTNRHLPQLFAGTFGSLANDTNDFWELSDTRRFTGEALAYLDRVEDDPSVSAEEKLNTVVDLVRAPLRYDAAARLRLRQNLLGAFDALVTRAQIKDAQVTNLSDPGAGKNDVDIFELAGSWNRSFNLRVIDLFVEATYSRQARKGVVENDPEQVEDVNILSASPTISRFLGPDKLTIGGSYVYFDLPDTEIVPVDEQKRARILRTAFIDYAFYRPMIMPQWQHGTWAGRRLRHRGWHFFAAAQSNDEQFGQTMIRKADYSLGSAFKGLGNYNITVAATRMSSKTEISKVEQDDQRQSQLRANLVLLRRIVDPDVTPGMPGVLQSMSIALPLRHDWALEGPTYYQNFRVGLDLWTMLFAEPLRGSGFLINAGADFQRFYNVDRNVFMGHVRVGWGWPNLGNLPAYQ